MTEINHHVMYKEIQGIDKVVRMSRSEHRNLHLRLRKEGKCTVSPEVLHKISVTARGRTEYGKKKKGEYMNENVVKKSFYTPLTKNARLCERIIANKKTGNITITSYFEGRAGREYNANV